ncbi:MAG: polyvinylalcohol dehydrogenase, partial [Planctomycetes bacterium]|nr:polyvinylalcohol dehydrogenase [Planctomycetota bacterium]
MVRGLGLACALVVTQLAAFGADWPHFRGPNSDGICTETGLLKEWPAEGPKLLWTATGFGRGYSSTSIVAGRLYTMGDIRGDDGTEAGHIIALDLATQKILWKTRVSAPHPDGGPRCTPTFDGGLLYALSPHGDLACVQAADGKEVWRKDFARDFGGKMMSQWRFSESPLVDGDNLICTPGGPDAVMVALNKKTGESVWKCAMPNIGGKGNPGAGYSSIVIGNGAGVKQYVQTIGKGCIGVAAKDGKFLWGYNKIANGVANIPTPVVDGDYVFCSTAYKTGAALLKLLATGDGGVKAEEVYFIDFEKFQNHHGGMVKVGDHIYGGSGQNA